jgi:hypothetical protein
MTEIFTEIWIQSIILGNFIVTRPTIPLVIACSFIATVLAVSFVRGNR